MMGRQQATQAPLFYAFNLDDHVPADHLLRGIDRFLDLGELRAHLAPYYSRTAAPSIDPELMIRMLIVGYCFGIRSERRLCEEVHLNLAYRWFCRWAWTTRCRITRRSPRTATVAFVRATLRIVFEKVAAALHGRGPRRRRRLRGRCQRDQGRCQPPARHAGHGSLLAEARRP